MENRTTTPRIYGEYYGNFDLGHLKNAEEWELFLNYHALAIVAGKLKRNTELSYSKGDLSSEEHQIKIETYDRMLYPIEYCVYLIAKKINIHVSELALGQHVEVDFKGFRKWYQFWANYFFDTMKDEDFKEFFRRYNIGEDVSEFLPKTSWRDS